jgi:hypothetical protein
LAIVLGAVPSQQVAQHGCGSAAPVSSSVKQGKMKPRIMYIENKSDGESGPARIGLITFSKSGKSIYYQGKEFRSLKGSGLKSNYFEVESGDNYWISRPKKNGTDRLYSEKIPTEIDEDVREEYWIEIRQKPENKHKKNYSTFHVSRSR